jgi:hypothetical protein
MVARAGTPDFEFVPPAGHTLRKTHSLDAQSHENAILTAFFQPPYDPATEVNLVRMAMLLRAERLLRAECVEICQDASGLQTSAVSFPPPRIGV